jgi:thiol-disulfide isomerase/thioredoxin
MIVGGFMKKNLIIISICLFVITNVYSQSNKVSDKVINAFREAGIPVLTEGVMPRDFTLPMFVALPAVTETNFTLSQFKGKVVFLNFWATWCPPCRAEMPSMESLYQKLKDRGLEIIAVNLGESRNEVLSFMTQQNLSFPAVLDTRRTTGTQYNVRAIPTSYIIDKRGFIVAHLVGSIDWDTPKVIAAFESLLD